MPHASDCRRQAKFFRLRFISAAAAGVATAKTLSQDINAKRAGSSNHNNNDNNNGCSAEWCQSVAVALAPSGEDLELSAKYFAKVLANILQSNMRRKNLIYLVQELA